MMEREQPETGPASQRKRPEDIQEDLQRTRTAIREDLQELGAKLKPGPLKETAKDAWRSARSHAYSAMSESVSGASQRAAHTVTENGAPLMLIGLGVGWLAMSMRKRREQQHWYEPEPPMEPPVEPPELTPPTETSARPLLEEPSRERAAARARRFLDDNLESGRDRMRKAQAKTRDLANDNPLAMGAVVAAAAFGIGMLLPATERENRMLGATRDRLVGQARDLAHEARSGAQRVKETARSTMSDVRETLEEPDPWH